ncbi:hypothetical protein [Clostridium butyricum]|uniref:hypothetical protein n=1 Tax=Clostridium butyricum TaxID=1492 RepID=UPI00168B44DE|nr:hypothetical protein [Clostridium butyricum]MDB2154093.1 hypothetical protein [Clostridium butyricum]
MIMKHVLLEMYCSLKKENEKPIYCEGVGDICIHNKCEYMGCTYCPNEIAFASEQGIVKSFDDCIGYGGEMEAEEYNSDETKILLNEWKTICKKKIDEAYDEYMEFKKNRLHS